MTNPPNDDNIKSDVYDVLDKAITELTKHMVDSRVYWMNMSDRYGFLSDQAHEAQRQYFEFVGIITRIHTAPDPIRGLVAVVNQYLTPLPAPTPEPLTSDTSDDSSDGS